MFTCRLSDNHIQQNVDPRHARDAFSDRQTLEHLISGVCGSVVSVILYGFEIEVKNEVSGD